MFERDLHAENAGDIEDAGFIALCGRDELDVILRNEVRGLDIPRTEQGRAQPLEKRAAHIDDADSQRTEHPLVGVGAEKIDVRFFYVEREGTERLDSIEGKEHAAGMKQRAD